LINSLIDIPKFSSHANMQQPKSFVVNVQEYVNTMIEKWMSIKSTWELYTSSIAALNIYETYEWSL
jgi:hypothetical protein